MIDVKLKVSRGGLVDGRYRSSQPGDIVSVNEDEAERLVTKGRAEYVSPPKAKKQSKPKAKTDDSKDSD